MAADLEKIESIFESTLASHADRYGKRIAYYQSLPTIISVAKHRTDLSGQTSANCPIYEDGLTN